VNAQRPSDKRTARDGKNLMKSEATTQSDLAGDLVTILIVTYNSEKIVAACLDTLPRDRKIIVLDNGSRDRTVEIASQYPQVEVLRNGNIGYGRAANLGLSKVTTPYALLINPDVSVDGEAIQAMLDCAGRHPEAGIIGGRMFHQANGQMIYERTYHFEADGFCYSDWVIGALMLLRMEPLRRVGPFDENIFLFFEESDLFLRFEKAGLKIGVCRDALAEHSLGSSTPPSLRVIKIRAWHYAWSHGYFYKKHHGSGTLIRKSLPKALDHLVNALKYSLLLRREKAATNLFAILGTVSFFLGIKAFKENASGRLT
jgi:GT2 family glycosyltransferase